LESHLVSDEELIRILRKWEARYWSETTISSTRRREERFKVQWKLKVAAVNKQSPIPLEFDDGWIINISKTGLGFVTKSPISPGDWSLCLLNPRAPNTPFIVLVKTIWQKPVNSVFATGTEFWVWQNDPEQEMVLHLARKFVREKT
jgi:hypothetical protein